VFAWLALPYLLSVLGRKKKDEVSHAQPEAVTWEDKEADGKLVIRSCPFRDLFPVSGAAIARQ